MTSVFNTKQHIPECSQSHVNERTVFLFCWSGEITNSVFGWDEILKMLVDWSITVRILCTLMEDWQPNSSIGRLWNGTASAKECFRLPFSGGVPFFVCGLYSKSCHGNDMILTRSEHEFGMSWACAHFWKMRVEWVGFWYFWLVGFKKWHVPKCPKKFKCWWEKHPNEGMNRIEWIESVMSLRFVGVVFWSQLKEVGDKQISPVCHHGGWVGGRQKTPTKTNHNYQQVHLKMDTDLQPLRGITYSLFHHHGIDVLVQNWEFEKYQRLPLLLRRKQLSGH